MKRCVTSLKWLRQCATVVGTSYIKHCFLLQGNELDHYRADLIIENRRGRRRSLHILEKTEISKKKLGQMYDDKSNVRDYKEGRFHIVKILLQNTVKGLR